MDEHLEEFAIDAIMALIASGAPVPRQQIEDIIKYGPQLTADQKCAMGNHVEGLIDGEVKCVNCHKAVRQKRSPHDACTLSRPTDVLIKTLHDWRGCDQNGLTIARGHKSDVAAVWWCKCGAVDNGLSHE